MVVWNGSEFVLENNILPGSEDKERDQLMVEDLYKLENNPEPEDGFYKIRISEFEQEGSYFEDFKLLKIDHSEEVDVGVIDGDIVAYKNIKKPDRFIVDGKDMMTGEIIERKEGQDACLVFDQLDSSKNILITKGALRSGDRRIEKISNFLKNNNTTKVDEFTKKALLVTTALLTAGTAVAGVCGSHALIEYKCSIHFYINGKNGKQVAISHPREIMSLNLIDIKRFAKNNKKLKVKMEWTDTHKFMPVGVAERVSVSSLDTEELKPQKITHSDGVDKMKLSPGETLTIDFPTGKSCENSTLLLKSRGYYERI